MGEKSLFSIPTLRICPSLLPVLSYKLFLLLSTPASLPPVQGYPGSHAEMLTGFCSSIRWSQWAKQAGNLRGLQQQAGVRELEEDMMTMKEKLVCFPDTSALLARSLRACLCESLPTKMILWLYECDTFGQCRSPADQHTWLCLARKMVLGWKWGRNVSVCNQV